MARLSRDVIADSAPVTSAPDHATTSNYEGVVVVGMCGDGNFGDPETTGTPAPVMCISGGHSLAQSFVLYFAPTVVVLALIMCLARLLFTYCAFRRHDESTVSPPTANDASRRHWHHHMHTVDVDQTFPMSFDQRGSFAHIFTQQPPPSYEQTQKYSVSPTQSNFDPAPPAYAYINRSCVTEHQPQQSARDGQSAVEVPPLPMYSPNDGSSADTAVTEEPNRQNSVQITVPHIE